MVNRGNALLVVGLGLLGAVLGWGATAYADATHSAGAQTALPIVHPVPAGFATLVVLPGTAGGFTSIGNVGLCRDDTGPCVSFDATVLLGGAPFGAAPFATVPAVYEFTYRPDYDPLQTPLGALPATTVDLASEWASCVAVEQALVSSRIGFNSGVNTAGSPSAPNIAIYVLTAASTGGAPGFGGLGLGDGEFYKFVIQQ